MCTCFVIRLQLFIRSSRTNEQPVAVIRVLIAEGTAAKNAILVD